MSTTIEQTAASDYVSFTLLSDAECRRRRNRWNRRYPNLDAWLAAHPGEAAGRVIGNPTITYCMGYGLKHEWVARWMVNRQPHNPEDIITEAQFCEFWGMPTPTGPPAELPKWPATPEDWNEKPKPTKAAAIKKVRAYMAKYDVTLAELGGLTVSAAASNGNGHANGTAKPRLFSWQDAGWK